MNTNGMALAPHAAANFGRKLSLARTISGLSYRDAAEVANVSAQYLNNIEKGTRLSPSTRVLMRVGRAYLMPEHAMPDLVFEARVLTAFEERGVPEPTQKDLYHTLEGLMAGAGFVLVTDIADIIREMLAR